MYTVLFNNVHKYRDTQFPTGFSDRLDLPQIQETTPYDRPGILSLDGTSLMEQSTSSLGFVPSATNLPADTEEEAHQVMEAFI